MATFTVPFCPLQESASHEFKTPLSSILSSAGLIARYDQPNQAPDRQRHIERIKASVNHLNTVLSDFLSISRLEEGQFVPAISEFVLRDMFDDLNGELRGLLKPGQELRWELPDSDRPVRTDPHILRNILYNLLSNAIKYSEPGKRITCELSWPDGATGLSSSPRSIPIMPAARSCRRPASAA